MQLPFLLGALEIDLSHIIQIEHCLREWESGLQVQISLDENIDAPRYRTHLANAISWRNLNKRMTDLICKHISGKLLLVPSEFVWSFN